MLQGSPLFNANEPTKDAYQDHFIIKPLQLDLDIAMHCHCIACHCLIVFYAKSSIELVEIPQNQPSISWSRAEITRSIQNTDGPAKLHLKRY